MDKDRTAHQTLLDHMTQPDERSPLFWYLIEHHDDLVAAAAGRRQRWRVLCADFQALGLTDGRGNAPSPQTARLTWWRVRREVARRMREKLTGIPARKKQPRDLPASTMPVLTPPQPGAGMRPVSALAGTEPAKAPGGSIARIRQLIDGR